MKHQADFIWPTLPEIIQQQQTEEQPPDLSLREGLLLKEGRIWVPDSNQLRLRIMIIGHCSTAGHRGTQTTITVISEKFWWQTLDEDVKKFVSKCLHCIPNGPTRIPRPLVAQLHANRPNQILHFDFL